MLKEGRPGLSEEQKVDMWQQWRRGETINDISASLGRTRSSIEASLVQCGGIAPVVRIRAARALTLAEREEISRGLCAGETLRCIAIRIGRSASTVSREVSRHSGRFGYRANHADYEARMWALRPKVCLLARNGRLRQAVAVKLERRWSPEQISGWLKLQYPDDESMHVSHETIYKSLFIQARGVLKQDLIKQLRIDGVCAGLTGMSIGRSCVGWFHFIGSLGGTGDFPPVELGDGFTVWLCAGSAPGIPPLRGSHLCSWSFTRQTSPGGWPSLNQPDNCSRPIPVIHR